MALGSHSDPTYQGHSGKPNLSVRTTQLLGYHTIAYSQPLSFQEMNCLYDSPENQNGQIGIYSISGIPKISKLL